jgi:hypothetical protein
MIERMRPFLALPLLLLASCMTAPADSGGAGGSVLSPAGNQSATEQAAALRAQAQRQVQAATGPSSDSANAPSGSSASSPDIPIDRNRKLETVDVFTDLMDPSSSKKLVSYLMKPEEWMVVRVDMPSTTTRWWRFQRVARTDGKSLPDVDPLRRP